MYTVHLTNQTISHIFIRYICSSRILCHLFLLFFCCLPLEKRKLTCGFAFVGSSIGRLSFQKKMCVQTHMCRRFDCPGVQLKSKQRFYVTIPLFMFALCLCYTLWSSSATQTKLNKQHTHTLHSIQYAAQTLPLCCRIHCVHSSMRETHKKSLNFWEFQIQSTCLFEIWNMIFKFHVDFSVANQTRIDNNRLLDAISLFVIASIIFTF